MNLKSLALACLSAAVWATTQPLVWATVPAVTIAQSLPSVATSETLTANRASFGRIEIDAKGNNVLIPANLLPMIPEESYGWRMQLTNEQGEPYQGEVTWREVFRVPAPPAEWTGTGEFAVSTDGTEGVTTYTQVAANGWIDNSWTFLPGDPLGQYQIEVYVGDRLLATFDFEVVDPSGQ